MDIRGFAQGESHILALSTEGRVLSTGFNEFGQLGNGTRKSGQGFENIEITGIKMISAGSGHSLALNTKGEVFWWGRGDSLDVENGGPNCILKPEKFLLETEIVQIAAGRQHGLMVGINGDIFTFGSNLFGQLGHQRGSQLKVEDLVDIKQVCGGRNYSLALNRNGEVFWWGQAIDTQGVPRRTLESDVLQPKRIPGLSNIKTIACGGQYNLALNGEGQVYGWGLNFFGQMGQEGKNSKGKLFELNWNVGADVPKQLAILDKVKNITATSMSSYYLLEGGGLYGLGYLKEGRERITEEDERAKKILFSQVSDKTLGYFQIEELLREGITKEMHL